MSTYGRPGTKSERTRRLVHELLLAKQSVGDLPTNGRFVFYELEQRGDATKPSPDDTRPNRRRSHGWPPGSQDVTDELAWLRDEGIVPWSWITDETRQVSVWASAPSVADYIRDRLDEATVNPWGAQLPPLILCESRATAAVLEAAVAEYCCPIAGLAGQCAGFFLHTAIKPLLDEGGRRVLYLGDRDKAGADIEANAWSVLEHLDWRRLAMTSEQAEGIDPIWKVDGRGSTAVAYPAWEVESLGQRALVELVRDELDDLLPEPLASVQERERVQREHVRPQLEALVNGDEAR